MVEVLLAIGSVVLFIVFLASVMTVVGLTRQFGSWLVDKFLARLHGGETNGR